MGTTLVRPEMQPKGSQISNKKVEANAINNKHRKYGNKTEQTYNGWTKTKETTQKTT